MNSDVTASESAHLSVQATFTLDRHGGFDVNPDVTSAGPESDHTRQLTGTYAPSADGAQLIITAVGSDEAEAVTRARIAAYAVAREIQRGADPLLALAALSDRNGSD